MNFELAKVEQWNLGLSASAVAASFVLATPHFAISLAAGAFLEAINLGAIHRAGQRLFAGEMMSRGWIGGLSLRFLILGTAIYITMSSGANPVALLIGLSIAMPATVIDACLNRPPIVDPSTLPVFLEDAAADTAYTSYTSNTDDTDNTEDTEDTYDDRVWKIGRFFKVIDSLPAEPVDERDR